MIHEPVTETRSTRLQKLRLKAGLTFREVEKKSGVSYSQVSKLEKDDTILMRPETVMALAKAYNVTPEEIQPGSYPDFSVSNEPQIVYSIAPNNARRIKLSNVTVREIKMLPIRARATFAESFADDSYKYEPDEYLAVPGIPDTKEFSDPLLVEIDGDSMEPTLKYGAIYITTPVPQSEWEYMNPDVYCIVYRSSFVVKRVKDNTLTATGLLTLHSDNEKGGTFDVRGQDIRAVWRVRWGVYVPI